jgi:hypothetical protein
MRQQITRTGRHFGGEARHACGVPKWLCRQPLVCLMYAGGMPTTEKLHQVAIIDRGACSLWLGRGL